MAREFDRESEIEFDPSREIVRNGARNLEKFRGYIFARCETRGVVCPGRPDEVDRKTETTRFRALDTHLDLLWLIKNNARLRNTSRRALYL